MKKVLINTLKIVVGIYIAICVLLYLFQEKLIFLPEKLDKKYKFSFAQKFQEINIKTGDEKNLDGILFSADTSKGLIFYLHGNAGSLRTWGKVAETYTDLNYDVFMLDYRGYGKSDGSINSEKQIFQDLQAAYNQMKKIYSENKIIVLGYSIGTGLACELASTNKPALLILQAPYYSLTDMMKRTYPLIPTFILKYKFNTSEYIQKCSMPVIIFHGDNDAVIYYGSSLKLKREFKQGDTLISLPGQGHNGITDNPEYIDALRKLLN